MSKSRFGRKISVLLASALALVLVLVSLVYACSRFETTHLALSARAMDGRMVERGPCDKHKQETCNTIRYQSLAIQALSPQSDFPFSAFAFLSGSSRDILIPSDSSPPPLLIKTAFHPVFQLSLFYSYLTLRI